MNTENKIIKMTAACPRPAYVSLALYTITTDELKKYKLRRLAQAAEKELHEVWCFTIGQVGGQLYYFWGHTQRQAVDKAMDYIIPSWKETMARKPPPRKEKTEVSPAEAAPPASGAPSA